MGEGTFDTAWAAGRALTVEEAAAEAMAVCITPAPPSAAASARPDGAVRHGLTAREVEVLRLLAERRTDKEIAAALFISPKTAGNHVANVLAKLGVANRREAADAAARLGLA